MANRQKGRSIMEGYSREPMKNQHTGLSDFELIQRIVLEGIYGATVSKTVAARILKVSRQTIYNMVADGRLIERNKRIDVRSIYERSLA